MTHRNVRGMVRGAVAHHLNKAADCRTLYHLGVYVGKAGKYRHLIDEAIAQVRAARAVRLSHWVADDYPHGWAYADTYTPQ